MILAAFQELRQERWESVSKWEMSVIKNCALPAGPERESREAKLKESTLGAADADESYLEREWEEFRAIFGYNAYEAADEWWVEWGSLSERAQAGMENTCVDFCADFQGGLRIADY